MFCRYYKTATPFLFPKFQRTFFCFFVYGSEIDDNIRTVQKHYAQYLDSYKKDEIAKVDAIDG